MSDCLKTMARVVVAVPVVLCVWLGFWVME